MAYLVFILFLLVGAYFVLSRPKRIRREVQELGELIVNNYEKGFQDSYCYRFENDSGERVQIWVGNGLLSIDTYPGGAGFNLAEKIFIRDCVRKANLKRSIA